MKVEITDTECRIERETSDISAHVRRRVVEE